MSTRKQNKSARRRARKLAQRASSATPAELSRLQRNSLQGWVLEASRRINILVDGRHKDGEACDAAEGWRSLDDLLDRADKIGMRAELYDEIAGLLKHRLCIPLSGRVSRRKPSKLQWGCTRG